MPTNWGTRSLPLPGDDVVVQPNDSTVDVAGLSIRNLTVRTPGRMSNDPGSSTLTVTGDISAPIGVGPAPNPDDNLFTIASPVSFSPNTHTIDTEPFAIVNLLDTSGTGAIVKRGTGTAELGTYNGTVDVVEGALAGDFTSSNATLTVRNGASLTVKRTGTSAPIHLEAGSSLTLANSADYPEITGPLVTSGGGSVRIDAAGVGGRLSGPISGSADLVVDNHHWGVLVFAGTNTMTGSVTVKPGSSVQALGSDSFGPGPVILEASPLLGGSVRVAPGTDISTPIVSDGGTIFMYDDEDHSATTPPRLSSPVSLLEDSRVDLVGDPRSEDSTAVLSGSFTGPGALDLINAGSASTFVLAGNNTNGGVIVEGGAWFDVIAVLATPSGVAAVSTDLRVVRMGTVLWTADDQVADDTNITFDTEWIPGAQLRLVGRHDRVGNIAGAGLIDLGADDGTATGVLEVDDLQFEKGSALGFVLDGPDADRLVVHGTVALGDSALKLYQGNRLPSASTITLIDNRSSEPVDGAFGGLEEGDLLDLGGVFYVLSYAGGDGNDVTLTYVDIDSLPSTDPDDPETGDPWTPTAYEGMTPVRVLETRAPGQIGYTGPRPAAGGVVQLHLGGTNTVPTDAAAVVLNLTAVDPTGAGYITVWPCGDPRPTAANLYHQPGQTIPNTVITKLGTNGDVCIYTQLGSDLVADLQGWYPGDG